MPKSGISSMHTEGRALLPLSHKLPVLPLDGLIPLRSIINNMMLRGLRLLQRASWGKSRNGVEWRIENNILELVLKNIRMIYVTSIETTFNELMTSELFKNTQFKFPKDFDTKITVADFLMNQSIPMSIQLRREDETLFLNNRAKQPETNALLRGFNTKRGMLQLSQLEMDPGQTRSLLTKAYLKLQAEIFCKSNNYTAKTQLTPGIREEILNYLCFRNETNLQKQIAEWQIDRQKQELQVAKSEQEIREIESDADKVLRLYQWGAIGITTFHLLTFGYMIFFVDWLGWDIIEPVTFSVSCLYLLLALRFYRKFRRDRNEQSIRERFRQLILSPKKLMRLKAAHLNLERQQEALRKINLGLLLYRNRLEQSTTLNAFILH